jgi:hypothetical protein
MSFNYTEKHQQSTQFQDTLTGSINFSHSTYFGPKRFRNIHPGARRTFLPAKLKRAPNCSQHHGVDIGRRVDEMVVLATTLADQTWIADIIIDVLTHLGPQPVERSVKNK